MPQMPPLHDHPDQKIDDGYASSSVSTIYSEELSFESDNAESDGECTDQAHWGYLEEVLAKGRCAQTESAGINVYGFYRKRTGCGGYAVLLRNLSAQPIAAIDKVSVDGKSHIFQVFAGLAAGVRLAARHGCSRPRVLYNSSIPEKLFRQVVPCSCLCQGSKIGKICHKCACSFFPGLSDDCFETLVPLIKELLCKKLCPFSFEHVLRMSNIPACYLAKQAKKKALVDYEASMKPDEFPDELVSFLLNDAYDCNFFY
ncbi:hypothetical protein MKW92_036901 [Papaver armeniacum]|nr:hypothetical protein MKW92_036901 [Papaver armeniacum]